LCSNDPVFARTAKLFKSLQKISSIGYERQIKFRNSAFWVHDVLHRTPFSGCSLHQQQGLLAVGSIIQNLICLLSPDHETFYRLRHDALHRTPKKAWSRT
jgi:hypothetical protein